MEQGYKLKYYSKSACVFPDGKSCEEWAFYRGECGSEYVKKITPTQETGPVEIPKLKEKEEITEEEKEAICNGCVSEDKCYPFGYRKSGEFCSGNEEFVKQLESGGECENNFECSSNVCVSGECVSPNLIQKIINFFKKLFGLD